MNNPLTTKAENTWCPGCGNFGIMAAFQKAVKILEEKGVSQENLVIVSGIGQHGKMFDYVNLTGVYGLHGRSTATAAGVKLGNPDLKVIVFSGDGDSMGEGLSHVMFGAKRNIDLTVILHDNQVYALTTGQFSPLSKKGYEGPSTPTGSIEEPLNPLSLMLEAGATFIARGYSRNVDHLADMIVKAVLHEGFSFVDALQPCIAFFNTYNFYNYNTKIAEDMADDYDKAIKVAKDRTSFPLGVFYQTKRQTYDQLLYWDRSKPKSRIDAVNKLVRG